MAGISLIDIEEWRRYYQKLLTEDSNQFLSSDRNESGTTIFTDNEAYAANILEITPEEITKTVNGMKNGKAPAPGNLNIELVKAVLTILYETLAVIYNKYLREDMVPNEWKKATITSIYKKGNRRDCSNNQGISVMPSLARLYGHIFKGRIKREIREFEEQNGFIPCGIVDYIEEALK